MGPVFTVNLNKKAFERLCELRDLIQDVTGEWIPLNQVCSTLICQMTIMEDQDEAAS